MFVLLTKRRSLGLNVTITVHPPLIIIRHKYVCYTSMPIGNSLLTTSKQTFFLLYEKSYLEYSGCTY